MDHAEGHASGEVVREPVLALEDRRVQLVRVPAAALEPGGRLAGPARERDRHGGRVRERRPTPCVQQRSGRRTDRVLWELARFGAGSDREEHPREPGNLRTIALPLRILLESVADRPELSVRLVVDDSEFTIVATRDDVDVEWGRTVDHVDIVVGTGYQAFLDVAEGTMTPDDFIADHIDVRRGAEHTAAFLALFGPAIESAN